MDSNWLNCLPSLKSIEEVHEWINRCANIFQILDHGERIYVDLSELERVSPIGIGTLVSTLKKMSSRYELKTLIPDNEKASNVIGYMERMDFFKVCPEEVRKEFEYSCDMGYYYNRNRTDQTNGLFELRETKEFKELGGLQKSVREIMSNKGLESNRVTDIASIVSELAENSIEHGKSNCFPCAQYYKSTRNVEIAICDYGMGIVRSLRRFVKYRDHLDLIEKAITTHASSLEDEDRGKGLMQVKQRTFDWSKIAKFYLRTHDSAYQVLPNKVKLINKGKFFYGTHLYIVINT